MKILFLCTYYHRAMIFRNLVDKLKGYGNEVKVFNAVNKGSLVDKKYKSIMDEVVIHRECFNKIDRFFYFHKQRKFYDSLINNIDISRYSIIHSHTLFNGGYVAYKIKKKYGIPYIVSVRNTDMNIFLKIPMFKIIANNIVKEAAGVHFLSAPYKTQFIEKYIVDDAKESVITKSKVIRNGLEEFWLDNKYEVKRTLNQELIKVICVGKIDKNKNIITTIKALEKLVVLGYKVKLTVIGQVLDESILKQLQVSNFTDIIGYLSKEELIEKYRESDIYVMPSINETFGRVYAEAMTQGLPVIYSKGQGFDGIFKDGKVGYAVTSKDSDEIAQSIIKIVKNYPKLSENCIKNCNYFSWNNLSKELEEFYMNSLKN